MRMIKKEVNGVNFTFVCETYSNSRAWGHIVHLFREDYEVSFAKYRYYNRTWECYMYQSCMQGAVREKLLELKKNIIDEYKYANNIRRMSASQKERVIAENDEFKLYSALYDTL